MRENGRRRFIGHFVRVQPINGSAFQKYMDPGKIQHKDLPSIFAAGRQRAISLRTGRSPFFPVQIAAVF